MPWQLSDGLPGENQSNRMDSGRHTGNGLEAGDEAADDRIGALQLDAVDIRREVGTLRSRAVLDISVDRMRLAVEGEMNSHLCADLDRHARLDAQADQRYVEDRRMMADGHFAFDEHILKTDVDRKST